MFLQVRDNYLQSIDNIQQADADAVFLSQMMTNSSTRYIIDTCEAYNNYKYANCYV